MENKDIEVELLNFRFCALHLRTFPNDYNILSEFLATYLVYIGKGKMRETYLTIRVILKKFIDKDLYDIGDMQEIKQLLIREGYQNII